MSTYFIVCMVIGPSSMTFCSFRTEDLRMPRAASFITFWILGPESLAWALIIK